MEILNTSDSARWTELLARSWEHDVYHQTAYHRLAEQREEGDALFFVEQEGDALAALPLLIRSLDNLPNGRGLRDATSVYGYCGPICSKPDLSPAFVERFQRNLQAELQKLRVVTVFSRLHPLIAQQLPLLEGLGHCVPGQQTVSIDLTKPLERQWAGYRKDHRRSLRSLGELGAVCEKDAGLRHLGEFVEIYLETMRRTQAASRYHFDLEYFEALFAALPDQVHLFIARMENEIVGGGIVLGCRGMLQAHLAGNSDSAHRYAPMKLVIDAERIWGTREGYRVFHLGGGLNPGPQDPLFQFKAGFSSRRHQFYTWRWVLDPAAYERLCVREPSGAAPTPQRPLGQEGFFPAYAANNTLVSIR